ncbi:MAG: hypothetical protein ACEQSB_02970 [Undibacterium sp.]
MTSKINVMLFCFSPLFLKKSYFFEAFMNQLHVAQKGVSGLHDMGHAVWHGCPLRPAVDIFFWVERPPGDRNYRIINARLVRPEETPVVADWVGKGFFDLATLGSDYLNLETEVMEMMVIARHVTSLTIEMDDEGPGITLILALPGGEQRFRLNVGIVGRWDWFINPREVSAGPVEPAQEAAMA